MVFIRVIGALLAITGIELIATIIAAIRYASAYRNEDFESVKKATDWLCGLAAAFVLTGIVWIIVSIVAFAICLLAHGSYMP